jgi:hypothetical protein
MVKKAVYVPIFFLSIDGLYPTWTIAKRTSKEAIGAHFQSFQAPRLSMLLTLVPFWAIINRETRLVSRFSSN